MTDATSSHEAIQVELTNPNGDDVPQKPPTEVVLPDQEASSKQPDPPAALEEAGCISTSLFLWLGSLLSIGTKRQLQEKDMFSLSKQDTADVINTEFERQWTEAGLDGKTPSIGKVLQNQFSKRFWIAGIFKFLNDCLGFVQPVLLFLLIRFAEDEDGSEWPTWTGYVLAGSLFCNIIIKALVENRFFFLVQRISMHISSAVRTAIFNKTLKLSSAARGQSTTGEIVNLMQLDAERLSLLVVQLHVLWSGAFQIAGYVTFLIYLIGWSALVGLALLPVSILLQGIVMKKLVGYTRIRVKQTDQRVKSTNEAIQGVRALKMYAWEDSFHSKIGELRTAELSVLKSMAKVKAANFAFISASPVIVNVITFLFYALVFDQPMTPSLIFTSIAVFNQLRFPLLFYPQVLSQLADCKVAVQRLNQFLGRDQVSGLPTPEVHQPETPIRVSEADFQWSDAAVTLKNISLTTGRGKLCAVVGPVGSGKSSLCMSLLGELQKPKGDLFVEGSIAFVAQSAWIVNSTLRENIVFGSTFDQARYDTAIRVACLDSDLKQLPDGDATEIGERGINLSGGQKQRVSIARAVYAQAELYIFDDPLSALDAEVGRSVFETCIESHLGDRTRLLVTNQLHFLPACDHIVVLAVDPEGIGYIQETGSFDELMAKGLDFSDLMKEHGHDDNDSDSAASVEDGDLDGDDETVPLKKRRKSTLKDEPKKTINKKKETKRGLMTTEERSVGAVGKHVYWAYFKAAGSNWWSVGIVFWACFGPMLSIGRNLWLSYWSEQTTRTEKADFEVWVYVAVFGAFGVAFAIVAYIRVLVVTFAAFHSSKTLHDNLLDSIFRATTTFFDTTPLGRIIARFSKDVDNIDNQVPTFTSFFTMCICSVIITLLMICVVTPLFTPLLLPLGFVYVRLMNYFRASSRELKRLDSTTRSPIIAHFSACLGGLPTIRAFRVEQRLQGEFTANIDRHSRVNFIMRAVDRWLALRLDVLGAFVVGGASIFAVLSRGDLYAGLIGMSLQMSLGITGLLSWSVRSFAQVENGMNCVERILHYTDNIQHEKPRQVLDKKPVRGWPSQGRIEFKGLQLKYRPELEVVLKGLSVTIEAGQKVGIVGRTGSGKSTTLVALLRLVEPHQGTIVIDGVDVSEIGLDDLRRAVSIIPQDPVLFSGSLRFNLDPTNSCKDDQEIWDVLEKIDLKGFVENTAEKLNHEVSENGDNFSAGQRQLICLARALLRKSKIVLLDEATSSVDFHTDQLIQQLIRTDFKHCTILTIAHRLNTIIDSDRILVLDNGRKAEFDAPHTLLQQAGSIFSSLIDQTGEASSQALRVQAREAFEAAPSNLQ